MEMEPDESLYNEAMPQIMDWLASLSKEPDIPPEILLQMSIDMLARTLLAAARSYNDDLETHDQVIGHFVLKYGQYLLGADGSEPTIQ